MDPPVSAIERRLLVLERRALRELVQQIAYYLFERTLFGPWAGQGDDPYRRLDWAQVLRLIREVLRPLLENASGGSRARYEPLLSNDPETAPLPRDVVRQALEAIYRLVRNEHIACEQLQVVYRLVIVARYTHSNPDIVDEAETLHHAPVHELLGLCDDVVTLHPSAG